MKPHTQRLALPAVLLALTALALASAWWPSAPEPPAAGAGKVRPSRGPPFELGPRGGPERPLAGGETHVYRLALRAGDYLELRVEQLGIDVVANLVDPGGEALEVDSPNGDRGPESILALIAVTGEHRLEVRAGRGAGRYRVDLDALRPATARDRERSTAARLFHRGEELRRRPDPEAAAPVYQAALARWRALGESIWQGETLDRLGQVHAAQGRWRDAADFHRQAWEIFQEIGNLRQQGVTQFFLGRSHRALGHGEDARACFERARALYRHDGNRHGEMLSLNSLGLAYRQRGEIRKALDAYRQALAGWRQLGDRRSEARTLHNLGFLQSRLGRERRALDFFEAAEELWATLDDARGRGSTLNQIGQLYLRRDEPEKAQVYLEHALELRREAGDRRGLAYTLASLALVRQASGDLEAAAELYRQARQLFVDLEEPRGEARTLYKLATLHRAAGRPDQALASFRRSLALYQSIGEPQGEADVWSGIAAVEREVGDLSGARRDLERALARYEALRRKAFGQDLRASYFALIDEHYGAYVDLLMELHRRQPEAGHDALALAASERARARSLLELVQWASAGLRHGAEPELLEREHAIQQELNATEQLRQRSRDSDPTSEAELRTLDRRLRELAEELDLVRGKIRVDSPASAVREPEPLGVSEIRDQVLDAGTLLLEVELGDRHSYLWLLGERDLRSWRLPAAAELETMAHEVYRSLVRSHRPESSSRSRRALCQLSRLLLAPVAGALDGQRLLVVTGGALEYVPFAALPMPRQGADDPEACSETPLLVEHEIVHLPSASTLAVLRRERAGRQPPSGAVAIFADPVTDASDLRLESSAAFVRGAPFAATEPIPRRFARIPFSRREAEAIHRYVDLDKSFTALGFEADKAVARSGVLADYRIVHFATHGVLNGEQPELSGLELSRFDARGQPRDGRLYAHEIYNLELNAEIVVLSACRTALGREMRGEGLVGLTHGFLHAGASRVLVSLWSVDDRVTAELMERFYRHLLADGLRPAVALRQAQLALWRQPRRRAPSYWAAFVLRGDWQ